MQLWVDAALIVILALLMDRFIGEVPNAIHPLRWMGNLLDAIDSRIGNRSSRMTSVLGFLSYLLVFLFFAGIGLLLTMTCRIAIAQWWDPLAAEIVWVIVTALIFKISFAIFSFRAHCDPICADLDAGRIDDAASKTQMIVSRKTAGMDAEHIASSCCETVSENLVDSVCSPVTYFGFLGPVGAVMFRCANLMDAMWGYLNDKYSRLGFFPAKFDDVLGYPTSRISPYYIALAGMLLGMDWKAAVPAARAEHSKTPSPNSGWSMTAASAVLGISMEKKDVYVMGTGPLPGTDDVRRCLRLIETASILYALTICLVAYAALGCWIQVQCEDVTYDIITGIVSLFG